MQAALGIENNSCQTNSRVDFVPAEYNSILAVLCAAFSLPALRDWLSFLIIGGTIELCRRCTSYAWHTTVQYVWVSASFDDDDACYNWVLLWLSRHPAWGKARCVGVTTRDFGLIPAVSSLNNQGDQRDTNRNATYIPSPNAPVSLWYRGHYMTVDRKQSENGTWGTKKEYLTINILALDNSILTQLLSDAKSLYKATEGQYISVYMGDIMMNGWRHLTSRAKRPLNSIILDPGIKEMILNDARSFLASQAWYAKRGIPFRRGYLLYGSPGSGKTSMIHSIAGELGLNIFVLTLSRSGMDDDRLNELVSSLPKRCILLMEDIDVAFCHGAARDGPQEDILKERAKGPGGDVPTSRVTLSGLLNALDGIAAQEGRILFATTNDFSALDPALCRPGRMDIRVEFKLASKLQAETLFNYFYTQDAVDGAGGDPATNVPGEKPSYAKYDIHYDGTRCPMKDFVKQLQADSTSAAGVAGYKLLTEIAQSDRMLLSHDESHELAVQFAEAIPEREFSVASLQGYLMIYKGQPYEAVRDASRWVQEEREERKNSKGLSVSS